MSNTSIEVRNYFKLELLIVRSYILLRQLFKHRYSLFTGGQTWDDTSTCGNHYLTNVIAKNKKFSLTGIQKTSISNGNSNEWDLTILTALLLNADRPKHLNVIQIKQLDTEDGLLIQLRNIRNTLAHHQSKSTSDTDFNQLWSNLKTILLAFGDVNDEIDKLKDHDIFDPSIQPINEENIKELLDLNSLGLCAHQEHRYSDAIILFTKATVLPDVSNRERATVYSNLSLSRLMLYEKEELTHCFELSNSNDQRYRALQDAKQARNLLPTWWKGHFCVGKVYTALNEYEKAIQSFERALALDPTNDEIQTALNESRQIHSRQLRYESLDPGLKPRTMPELLSELKEKFGADPQHVRMGHDLQEKIYPAGADVVRGHKYALGDINVKQDYEQAAKYFAQAANKGNAEGMYNLALFYDSGLGVKKDLKMATKLFEQAANQPPQHPILKHLRNPGVAEAEHALGLRYADGIDVKKNLSIAAQWYQRAIQHGSAQSANNLALMYQKGTGVEQNMGKAEQLFELSARKDDSNAMLNLAELLLNKGDLKMAKLWYDRACKAGNIIAQMDRKKFEAVLHKKQQLEDSYPSDILETMNMIKNLFESSTQEATNESFDNSNIYDYNVLKPYADNGSITAQKLCNALTHFAQALNILSQSQHLIEEQENRFIHELAQCYRIDYRVAHIPSVEIHQKVEDIIDRVFQRCNTESNANVSQLDEDVRTCYATLHIDSHQQIAQFLEQCKKRYPKSIHFFKLSVIVYSYLEQHEICLYNVNAGLEIDPYCCELLYKRALALGILDQSDGEIIEAYRTFLDIAPKDHPKVPGMYYIIAHHCLSCSDDDSMKDRIKIIYEQGIEAEKLQLPCFLPFTSRRKMFLENLFETNCSPVLETSTAPSNNRKSHLTNPYRIELIKAHREYEATVLKMKTDPKSNLKPFSIKPRLKQPKAKSLIGLKSISLREMNPTEDHIYNDCILSVKIIETGHSWTPSIHLIIEDENLDCERMCIYDFPKSHGEYLINNVYTIGTKMHIINPYLRIGAGDIKPLIRVDESSSIVMQCESEKVMKMCRCCGQPNAPHVCGICEKARYCSKECQTMDWKLYKHKLICQS